MMRAVFLAIGLTLGVFPHAAAAEIVFAIARLRAVLGDDAVWRSLVDKTAGQEFLAAGQRLPCAVVRVADATRVASQARREGDRLTIHFAGCDTRLVYAVETAPDWVTFRLAEVAGTRPTHVTLLQLSVAIAARGGSRLNAAWDDRDAVCLRGLNLQSQGVFGRRKDHTLLSVITQDAPGPKLEGSGAVLIASPTADLKPILQRLAVAYDPPRVTGANAVFQEGETKAGIVIPSRIWSDASYVWTDWGDFDHFEVFRYVAAGQPEAQGELLVQTTDYRIDGLDAGIPVPVMRPRTIPYYFRVRAVNSKGVAGPFSVPFKAQ